MRSDKDTYYLNLDQIAGYHEECIYTSKAINLTGQIVTAAAKMLSVKR